MKTEMLLNLKAVLKQAQKSIYDDTRCQFFLLTCFIFGSSHWESSANT